ncbi:MAG: MFS transporter, partial [Clostridia bacterium]|nr:MFS transporter [Clostridia bacterium]
MTKQEKAWVLYDVGNSAFTMLISTIIPIFFKNLAAGAGIEGDISTAYWGYAASITTIIVAIIGPVLGTLGDNKGYKLPLFMTFAMIGVAGCAVMGFATNWILFIAIFIIAKVGMSGGNIFYDSMLCDITSEDRMDTVSTNGYAWGYIGSCVPFAISLVLVLTAESTGIGTLNATIIAFIINAAWWLLCTLPLAKSYNQIHYVKKSEHPVAESFKRIKETLMQMSKNKSIFSFLLAFFFYIDGVYTIIEMATSYGKDVGITDDNLLLALLLTQIVAFPCAIIFGKIAKKVESTKLINISIIGYLAIALFAVQLDKTWEFWFLAVCVAIFQGGIQALSRSYFAKIVPKENSNEFFGIYDIFGKGAAFTGTLMVG